MLLKLHFEVLYRRVLFVMSIIYYFGDQNRGIPLVTASNIIIVTVAKFCEIVHIFKKYYRPQE